MAQTNYPRGQSWPSDYEPTAVADRATELPSRPARLAAGTIAPPMPTDVAVADEERTEIEKMRQLASSWLPLPAPPTEALGTATAQQRAEIETRLLIPGWHQATLPPIVHQAQPKPRVYGSTIVLVLATAIAFGLAHEVLFGASFVEPTQTPAIANTDKGDVDWLGAQAGDLWPDLAETHPDDLATKAPALELAPAVAEAASTPVGESISAAAAAGELTGELGVAMETTETSERADREHAIDRRRSRSRRNASPDAHLTDADVRAAVAPIKGQLYACGYRHGAAGAVRVVFDVAPDGHVVAAHAPGQSDTYQLCIEGVAKMTDFRATDHGGQRSYTLHHR